MDTNSSSVAFYSILACIALLYLLFSNLYWSKNLPPGPRPLPVIGNILQLGKNPHESLCHLAKVHGSLMTLRLGFRTTIIASSPAMAKHVLKTQDPTLSARTVIDAATCLSHSDHSFIWRDCVPRWRTLRRICTTELFSPKRLDALQHLRSVQINTMIKTIYRDSLQASGVDIGHTAFLASVNLLGNMIFSKNMFDGASENSRKFKDAITTTMVVSAAPNSVDFFPFLRILDPQSVRRKLTKCIGVILGLFDEYIEERLQTLRNEGSQKDFLDILLENKTETGENFTKLELTHIFFDLFGAGTDTTSTTIEWAMAELIRNPEIMKKVKKELDEVVGKERIVQERDIDNLLYLHSVLKETLRLHPPAPLLIQHKAQSSCEIDGYIIPKDAQVFVNVWAIGRDPVSWKDPERFFPDRFLESKVDYKGQNFELIPFGSGRRICPGLSLSHHVIHIEVASLVQCFDWCLPNAKSPKMLDMSGKFGITLQKAEHLVAISTPCMPNHIYN